MGEDQADQAPQVRILWFHPRPLLPSQGGGDLRTLGLVSEVVACGHDVLLVTAGSSDIRSAEFDILPVAKRAGVSNAAAKVASRFPLRAPRLRATDLRSARRAIAGFRPSIAVVSEVMTGSLAFPLLPEGLPWIYDAQNVEHELFERLATEATGVFDRITFAVDRRRVSHAERELVRRSSAVIAVSPADAAGLSDLEPGRRPPVVVPSSVATPPEPAHPGRAEPIILFVGTLDFPPNVGAVTELCGSLLPRVREHISDARLVVAGRKATPELRALLAASSHVDFFPDLRDLATVYRAARCVALPIRFGGGSRLKVYEALAWGQAVVGTEAALAGIPIPESAVLRAETTDDLVRAVVRVLSDDLVARDLGVAARQHFVAELSLVAAVRPLLDLIGELT